MRPTGERLRRSLAVLVATGVGASAFASSGIPAAGAAGGVSATLNLKGGYRNHQEVACGDLHHYTYFHKGGRVKLDGRVTPAPAGKWRVKLKLKRCSHGAFRTVYQHHFKGRSGGRFDGSFRRTQSGHYFARIYYYGVTPTVESDKQQFRIKG